jgi:excisionase family DNA binding protein
MRGGPQVEREFESLRWVAEKTGKSYRTIHRAVRAGKIKTIRFGGSVMVSKQEVARVLTKGF